jgi:hypothetical protein
VAVGVVVLVGRTVSLLVALSTLLGDIMGS